MYNRTNVLIAIALKNFYLNIVNFPNSWGVYDSQAETYLATESNDLANMFYKRSLEITARNSYAIQALRTFK